MKKVAISFFILAFLQPLPSLAAETLAAKLSGRILLQVESRGEAWYVRTSDLKRYSLGRPADAFEVMKRFGVGISNGDLEKIPVFVGSVSGQDLDRDGLGDDLEVSLGTDSGKPDTDGDGFSDKVEVVSGYDPKGPGRVSVDVNFSSKQKGRIFLQVQSAGEAWYVDPVGGRRHFLGRPADAFAVMRGLGLGISDSDLNKIASGSLSSPSQPSSEGQGGLSSPLDLLAIERRIHTLINEQRSANGLPALKLNDEVAAVAREHSGDLAEENLELTDLDKICNYAMIHHEGRVFGLMPADRLNNRDVNYYSKAGENIALIGAAEVNYLINTLTFSESEVAACQSQVEEWNSDLKADMESLSSESAKIARLSEELSIRRSALSAAKTFQISSIGWRSVDSAAQESVTGWMNSPGHRANILDSAYDEAGVGVAYVNGYIVATQVFIKRADCGYEGGPCCERRACYLPTTCAADQICR